MSIRSMTGFARAQKFSEEGEAVITVKSVNHRGLDIRFHMPDDLDVFESALREVLRRYAVRGSFQVRVAYQSTRPGSRALNSGLLNSYLATFRQAADELGLPGSPDLNAALSLPGMFHEEAGDELDEGAEKLLVSAMEEAMQALNAFREREGGELAAELLARAAQLREAAGRMEELRARAVPAFQARLTARLAELLGGSSLEPQRLAQEAALLADRSDISEELTRLKVHVAQLEDLMKLGGEIGKKMDFLLQEMSREANTILSKSTGIGEVGMGITDLALAAKADIEKIREQSLNLE
jgi:uncharacterized protein (TIGR00255 family)